jgi:hypothetical protein
MSKSGDLEITRREGDFRVKFSIHGGSSIMDLGPDLEVAAMRVWAKWEQLKRGVRPSTCRTRKIQYDEAGAEEAAADTTSTNLLRGAGQPARAYLCPLCSSWHVTKQPLRSQGGT